MTARGRPLVQNGLHVGFLREGSTLNSQHGFFASVNVNLSKTVGRAASRLVIVTTSQPSVALILPLSLSIYLSFYVHLHTCICIICVYSICVHISIYVCMFMYVCVYIYVHIICIHIMCWALDLLVLRA